MTTLTADIKKYTDWLPAVGKHLPLLGVIVVVVLLFFLLARLLLHLWDWRIILKQKYVFLEVTPPATSEKSPLAAQELIGMFHGTGLRRNLRDKLFGGKMMIAFEVGSDKPDGVRYIIRTPAQDLEAVKGHIISFSPSAKTRILEDFLPDNLNNRSTTVVEFTQKYPWPFPLKAQESFEDHDPIPYLTNAMTDLSNGEQITFQIVATPVVIPDKKGLIDKLLRSEDLISHLGGGKRVIRLQRLFAGVFFILSSIFEFVVDIFFSSSSSGGTGEQDRRNQLEVAKRNKPARSLSPIEQKLHDTMQFKAEQPLFRAEIRALIAIEDKEQRKQRVKALHATLSSFDTTHQGLRRRHNFPALFKARYRMFVFTNRLPSLFTHHSSILAASEIADIYHLPTSAAASDNLNASYSRTLAAPPSLRQSDEFDVVLGMNIHHGKSTPIGLNAKGRERHAYIIGGTGNGKTTMMEYAIIQDIKNGHGVGFIDPHGDAAKKILRYIPEERIKDVVYFHPDDIDFSVGFNPLDIDPSITGSARIKLETRVINMIVEALRKTFSDDGTGGHRIESILRNGLITAMTVEGATLFTVSKLLRNLTYRKSVVDKIHDERLLEFWNEELGKAGDMQRVSMTKGVTTKLDRFESDPIVARILGQKKSTINFSDIINGKKVLICDLAKGDIGSDNSTLLGTLILVFLQIAAEQRSRIEQDERVPFYLYVDEFQNFATMEFTEMANEARKYGLFLTMAEQTTSQIEEQRMLGMLLANVGTIITFKTGNPADESMLLPFFGVSLKPGEINSLDAYNFYARLASQEAQAPVSGKTIRLEDAFGKGSKDNAQRVIEASRATYGHEYAPETRVEDAGDDEDGESTTITNPQKEPS